MASPGASIPAPGAPGTMASATSHALGANPRDAGKPRVSGPGFDVDAIRRDFPILAERIHGRALVYLDNAATTQKPRAVLDAERAYYEHDNANVHRGVHLLSERATKDYEAARKTIASFVNAKDEAEVVYTRGTTEALNLVANSFARARLKPGDEVLATEMEHHSNLVPWQLACEASGATMRYVPITDAGELDLDAFHAMLSPRTRLVAVGHVSNALGTVNPVAQIARAAREVGAATVVDGAQATPHVAVDVQALGVDFYAASGHKMYGPTGIGFLWARREHLEAMPPWQGGGDMIRTVSLRTGTTFNDVPYKFEAGTPNIAGAIGLGAAARYVSGVGLAAIARHEHDLLTYATERLASVKGLRFVGQARDKAAVVSFTLEGIHPHDIGSLLDRDGIAIRTGHHCAMPVMERYGLPATCRASFAMYNTRDEVDALVASLENVVRIFG